MIVALTGTPGIGKTSIANILKEKGFLAVDITKIAIEKSFLIGNDEKRDSKIVDVDVLNKYVEENYKDEDIVFIDGHLSHLLACVDKVIVLRCHPDKLRIRLSNKGWREEKIKENLEAEILDVILCEAVDLHLKNNIFEIDTTRKKIKEVVLSVVEIVKSNFEPTKKYNIGKIDWSEEILKEF